MDHWVIQGNRSTFTGDLFEIEGLESFPSCRHHHTRNALGDQVGARHSESGSEQSVGWRGSATPLHMSEDRDPRFEARPRLQLLGKMLGAARLIAFVLMD